MIIITCSDSCKKIITSATTLHFFPFFKDCKEGDEIVFTEFPLSILEEILDNHRYGYVYSDALEKYTNLLFCNNPKPFTRQIQVGAEEFDIEDWVIEKFDFIKQLMDPTWGRGLFIDMNPVKFRHILNHAKDPTTFSLPDNCINEYLYLMPKNEPMTKSFPFFSTKAENWSVEFLTPLEKIFNENANYSVHSNLPIKKVLKYETLMAKIPLSTTLSTPTKHVFVIPQEQLFISYYMIEIKLTNLFELLENIPHRSIQWAPNANAMVINNILVRYGKYQVVTISGEAMTFRNFIETIDFPQEEKDVLTIPFPHFLYGKEIYSHPNFFLDDLLTFEIKLNDVFDYLLVDTFNEILPLTTFLSTPLIANVKIEMSSRYSVVQLREITAFMQPMVHDYLGHFDHVFKSNCFQKNEEVTIPFDPKNKVISSIFLFVIDEHGKYINPNCIHGVEMILVDKNNVSHTRFSYDAQWIKKMYLVHETLTFNSNSLDYILLFGKGVGLFQNAVVIDVSLFSSAYFKIHLKKDLTNPLYQAGIMLENCDLFRYNLQNKSVSFPFRSQPTII